MSEHFWSILDFSDTKMTQNWPESQNVRKLVKNVRKSPRSQSDTVRHQNVWKKTNFQNLKNHRFQHLRSIKSPKLRLLELTRYLSPRKFSDIFALSSYNFLTFLDLDKLISWRYISLSLKFSDIFAPLLQCNVALL